MGKHKKDKKEAEDNESLKEMVKNQFNDSFDNVIDDLLELMDKKEFKKKLIKKLNESVDVPLIDEKTEGKIINAIYDIIIKELKNLNKD